MDLSMLPQNTDQRFAESIRKLEDESGLATGLTFDIRFFEGITKRAPDHLEALSFLAYAYTRRAGEQDLGKRLAIDKRLTVLKPEDATIRYNLACSYSLLGDADRAIEALGEAIKLGFDKPDMLSSDSDLDNIRNDPRFQTILKAG